MVNTEELARLLHIPANRITQIIAGQRSITVDTAIIRIDNNQIRLIF